MLLIQSTEKHSFTMHMLIENGCSTPSGLFSRVAKLIKSLDGTIQGDPTAMTIYTLGITSLLGWLRKLYNKSTEQLPSHK